MNKFKIKKLKMGKIKKTNYKSSRYRVEERKMNILQVMYEMKFNSAKKAYCMDNEYTKEQLNVQWCGKHYGSCNTNGMSSAEIKSNKWIVSY